MYMSVFRFGEVKPMEKEIRLSGMQESKYKAATAIRRYFRNNV